MKRLYSISLLLVLSSLSYGQIAGDSIHIERLIKQIGRYSRVAPDSALWLSDSSLSLANKLQLPKLISKTHYLRGVALKNKSKFEEAESAYQLAKVTAHKVGDSLLVADGVYGLGVLKRHQGEYSEALILLNQALQIRQNNDASQTELARTYNGIGNVLYTIGKTRRAIELFKKSLAIHQATPGRERFVASSNANIGGMYVGLGVTDSAVLYLQPALDYFQAEQYPIGIGAAAINLAEAYLIDDQLAQAKYYAQMALTNFQASEDEARVGMALNTAAGIAAQTKDYATAIDYAIQSLRIAQAVNRPDNIRDQYKALAGFYAQAEEWEAAFTNYKAYTAIKDSLFNETVNAQLETAQQEFEAFAKDKEIETLKAAQLVQRRRRNLLFVGLLLTACFLVYAFRMNQVKRKALNRLQEEQEQTQRLLSEKEVLLKDLKSAQLQLIENEKMVSLGQLTAGIAHEINNPINFVAANLNALEMDMAEIEPVLEELEHLKQQPHDESALDQLLATSAAVDLPMIRTEINDLLKSIGTGAERTRNIVHSLKVFSRNTSEQFLPADLNEGILSTIALMKGNLPMDIAINTQFADLPPVICKISRLNQVFLNLINNSVQAIEGAGRVDIRTELLPEKLVKITFSDNGMGMDEATRKRIFEPFFTTKSVGKGTGLGLSISFGIIKQHQGEIAVESTPGKGTTFCLTIPVQPA
ncbi:MAG: ATP-binding protein [Bacteroidota bacterium]